MACPSLLMNPTEVFVETAPPWQQASVRIAPQLAPGNKREAAVCLSDSKMATGITQFCVLNLKKFRWQLSKHIGLVQFRYKMNIRISKNTVIWLKMLHKARYVILRTSKTFPSPVGIYWCSHTFWYSYCVVMINEFTSFAQTEHLFSDVTFTTRHTNTGGD